MSSATAARTVLILDLNIVLLLSVSCMRPGSPRAGWSVITQGPGSPWVVLRFRWGRRARRPAAHLMGAVPEDLGLLALAQREPDLGAGGEPRARLRLLREHAALLHLGRERPGYLANGAVRLRERELGGAERLALQLGNDAEGVEGRGRGLIGTHRQGAAAAARAGARPAAEGRSGRRDGRERDRGAIGEGMRAAGAAVESGRAGADCAGAVSRLRE